MKSNEIGEIGTPEKCAIRCAARWAPAIWALAWACSAMTAQAQAPGFGPGPFAPAPPPPISNPAALPALAQGVVIDVRKLVDMVRLELDVSPAGQQLATRVNVLLGTADNFNRMVNGRTPPHRLFEAMAELQGAHRGVTAELSIPAVGTEAPGCVRMNQRIGARIGQLQAGLPRPGPMPGPGPGVPREVLLHRALNRELKGLIAEVDVFVGDLNPKVPEGPQLQAEAINLQNALRTVKADFNRPRPEPVLVADFNHAVIAHRVLSGRVERLNQGRVGPNVQRIRNIGATLARIQQAVPGL